MDNIEIDPAKEMQHLQAMYMHYKILYLVMLFRRTKSSKKKER